MLRSQQVDDHTRSLLKALLSSKSAESLNVNGDVLSTKDKKLGMLSCLKRRNKARLSQKITPSESKEHKHHIRACGCCIEGDDSYSPVNLNKYLKWRVIPLLHLYKQRRPRT